VRAAPFLLIVGAALAVPAGREATAQSFVPPIGRPQTGPACIRVINTTDYWFPVQIAVPGQGEPATFRIEKREFRQFCATVALRPGERIEVVLRSFMAPIGRCLLDPGGQAEIVRGQDADGDPINRLACKGGISTVP
jgi:hypothetical protein